MLQGKEEKIIKYLFGGGKKYLIKIHKYNIMIFRRGVCHCPHFSH